MLGQRLLAETLPALFETAPPLLGLRALGMVWTEAAGDIFVTCAMPNGVSSVRLRTRNEIRRRAGALDRDIRREQRPGWMCVERPDSRCRRHNAAPVQRRRHFPAGAEQAAGLQAITDRAATVLTSNEPPDGELARLRREVAVDRLLPALLHAPHVRGIVEAVSRTCADVMPVSEVRLELAGGHGGESTRYISRPGGVVAVESQAASALPWSLELGGLTYQLVQADAQRRSSVRVPLRVDGAVVGVLTFSAEGLGALTPG